MPSRAQTLGRWFRITVEVILSSTFLRRPRESSFTRFLDDTFALIEGTRNPEIAVPVWQKVSGRKQVSE
jgi:hypothetical protein